MRFISSTIINKRRQEILQILTAGMVIIVFTYYTAVASAQEPAPPQVSSVQELGKLLFFDVNLSTPPGQSCATCHEPTAGFADPRGSVPVSPAVTTDPNGSTVNMWTLGLPVSAGVLAGMYGSRNAQSAAYAAFSPSLFFDPAMRPGIMEGMYVGGQFWDGRENTLEEQAMGPPLNPLEMHNPNEEAVIAKLRQRYSAHFEGLFGSNALDDVNTAYVLMAQAIAEYERSSEVCRFDSKYDQHVANPEMVPLSDSELRGLALFTGKARCFNCHSLDTTLAGKALFTNFGYQNIGIPKNPENPYYYLPKNLNPDGMDFVDLGLGGILHDASQYGKFKIPSLRNVAITGPYMHNGVFRTLQEVVHFDNTRDVAAWPPPEVDMNVHRHMPPMPGTFGRLGLTEAEENDIVDFLTTLTDGYVP
jgi:cytochrome c peroxidase